MIKVHDIEQRSEQWFKLRSGRVGGSEADKLTTLAKMKTLSLEKITQIITGYTDEDSFIGQAAEDGINHEGEVAFVYEMETGNQTEEAGYITNNKYKYGGLSPDRYVSDSDSKHAIEIKFPQPKAHIAMCIEGKPEKKYFHQILWYFVIDERLNQVDFISYCPDVKTKPKLILNFKRSDLTDDISKIASNYFKFENMVESGLKVVNYER